ILCTLSAKTLWNYYKSFSPHKMLDSNCNVDNMIESDSDSVLNTLFRIFLTLKSDKVHNVTDKNYLYYKPGIDCSDMYLPTTIAQGTPSRLARDILLNPLMISKLYEIRNLICDESIQTIENLELECNRISGGISLAAHTDDLLGEEREKMVDIKNNLRLIPQSAAMEIINAD
ncbi:MAG: hypothetical protein KAR20_13585, partial [Candidatus Heimdallarchaeota archaeon]|nr:hypothetical protein [Candidatus Heimdallarchaeota archaeon]